VRETLEPGGKHALVILFLKASEKTFPVRMEEVKTPAALAASGRDSNIGPAEAE